MSSSISRRGFFQGLVGGIGTLLGLRVAAAVEPVKAQPKEPTVPFYRFPAMSRTTFVYDSTGPLLSRINPQIATTTYHVTFKDKT